MRQIVHLEGHDGRDNIVERPNESQLADGDVVEGRLLGMTLEEHLTCMLVRRTTTIAQLELQYSPCTPAGTKAYDRAHARLEPESALWKDRAGSIYIVNELAQCFCIRDKREDTTVPFSCQLPGDAEITEEQEALDELETAVEYMSEDDRARIFPAFESVIAPAIAEAEAVMPDKKEDWHDEVRRRVRDGEKVIEVPMESRKTTPRVSTYVLVTADHVEPQRAFFVQPEAQCATCSGSGLFKFSSGTGHDAKKGQQVCPRCIRKPIDTFMFGKRDRTTGTSAASKPKVTVGLEKELEHAARRLATAKKNLDESLAILSDAGNEDSKRLAVLTEELGELKLDMAPIEAAIANHENNITDYGLKILNKKEHIATLQAQVCVLEEEVGELEVIIQNNQQGIKDTNDQSRVTVTGIDAQQRAIAAHMAAWLVEEARLRRRHKVNKYERSVSRCLNKKVTLEERIRAVREGNGKSKS